MATHADPASLRAEIARLQAQLAQLEKPVSAEAEQTAGDPVAHVLSLLKAADVPVREESHEPVLTVEAWQPFHAKFATGGSLLTKCLFFKGKKGGIFLIVCVHDTMFDTKALAGTLAQKELRFGADDLLKETLNTQKGSVNPFAITYDKKEAVTVLLDSRIAEGGETLFCFHPMDNSKTLMLTGAELQKFFGHVGLGGERLKVMELAKDAPKGDAPKAAGAGEEKKPKPQKQEKQPKPQKQEKPKAEKAAGAKTGVSIELKKDEDFAGWYQQVITRGEMIDYYDISGCYILRPNAYRIWQQIQGFFQSEIEKIGVEPCYFPMFVSKGALEKEESHVEGFAAEVAWVTKSGQSDLDQPIAIRPTSETVMYPTFKKWIRSYRDLPMRLNQWCNVVRWEFSHPTPFIRTREFLWQEGHTVHENEESAMPEVRHILDLYRQIYEDLLAVPVEAGQKTEKEKFAGGYRTTTVEAFIPTVGRSVQGATSHCLGQNFSKMFGIQYLNDKGEKVDAWQNSWGLTTRTIGVMVMVHGDDKGVSLPPRVAPTQVVVIPVGIKGSTSEEDAKKVRDECERIAQEIQDAGVRVKADIDPKMTPGDKSYKYEKFGVPVRINVGLKDLEKGEIEVTRRHNGEKSSLALDGIGKAAAELMVTVQSEMLQNAKKQRGDCIKRLNGDQWAELVPTLNRKMMALVPFCDNEECETQIKKKSTEESLALAQAQDVDERAPSMGAKSLCIPYNQPEQPHGKQCICPGCDIPAINWTLFGRSY